VAEPALQDKVTLAETQGPPTTIRELLVAVEEQAEQVLAAEHSLMAA
jgi:hypothetical protein